MKSSTKSAIGITMVVLVVGLRIALAIARMNEPTKDYEFDPENIDLSPIIQSQFQQQQTSELDRLLADVRRTHDAAKAQRQKLRARWVEAQATGVVGETGVLYVPSKQELAYDGTPNEFGKGRSAPPSSGWYIVIKRTKNADGTYDSQISSGGSAN